MRKWFAVATAVDSHIQHESNVCDCGNTCQQQTRFAQFIWWQWFFHLSTTSPSPSLPLFGTNLRRKFKWFSVAFHSAVTSDYIYFNGKLYNRSVTIGGKLPKWFYLTIWNGVESDKIMKIFISLSHSWPSCSPLFSPFISHLCFSPLNEEENNKWFYLRPLYWSYTFEIGPLPGNQLSGKIIEMCTV